MAISMSLTPFSNAITATVTELEPKSRLVWYLDGKEFATETIDDGADTHTFTLAPVYFASTHVVKLEVYRADTDELVEAKTAQTSTLYADIPLWSWSESNGLASREQTSEAYQAAITQGLVANYSHLVWDDFVRLLKNALDEVGLPWLNTYGSYSNTLVGEIYGSLTAQRFNAVVQNIRYPYWTWEGFPGSYGYLGRQAVRSGDTVYGLYMTELAKYLNVVLGIYNGTANTRETSASIDTALAHDAIARSLHTAPIWHTSNLGSVREDAGLAYQSSVRLLGDASAEHLALATLHTLRQIKANAASRVSADVVGDLTKRISANVASAYSVSVLPVGSAIAVRPVITVGSTDVGVASVGALSDSHPKYTQSEVVIITDSSGGINQKLPEKMRGSASNVIDFAAAVKLMKTIRMTGYAGISVNGVGTVGGEPVDTDWNYPSRNGNVLYIPQSYHTDRIADGIRIAWKPVVAYGSTMYIPQVFHADQRDDTLSIVYYSPVRTEDTLYIKQMNETLKGV